MSTERNHVFEMEFAVRDYECDMQGIVNNSVYFNYLEHTRHEYAKSCGNSFLERTKNGQYFVVGRADITFKRALKSGDRFVSKLAVEEKGRRKKVFYQEIFRSTDGVAILSAAISVYLTETI